MSEPSDASSSGVAGFLAAEFRKELAVAEN